MLLILANMVWVYVLSSIHRMFNPIFAKKNLKYAFFGKHSMFSTPEIPQK